jgi:hypothetical protein
MIAIAWLFSLILLAPTETRWRLPVTIKVLQDVPIRPYPQDARGEQRGVLYIGREGKGFVIKKGQTFQMIKIGQEGGCWIRFEKKEYGPPSCPWLDGFRDHQTDIFRILTPIRGR